MKDISTEFNSVTISENETVGVNIFLDGTIVLWIDDCGDRATAWMNPLQCQIVINMLNAAKDERNESE